MYELKPGVIVGKYCLEEVCGSGGFGAVWKARHSDARLSNKRVAIKFGLNLIDDAKGRFDNEIKILDELRDNPYIIKVEDAGDYGPFPYLALELAGVGSLDDYTRQYSPSLTTIADWLGQLANALDYAHSKGIIHRDLKPSNILFMQDGTLRLCDFGIAHDNKHNLTVSGYSLGTPAYMAPEQIKGFKNVGPEADIWSLAVITLELITGRALYDIQDITSIVAAYEAVMSAVVPKLITDRTGATVPSGIQEVLERALEKDPQIRKNNYESVKNFVNAFILTLTSKLQPTVVDNSVVKSPDGSSHVNSASLQVNSAGTSNSLASIWSKPATNTSISFTTNKIKPIITKLGVLDGHTSWVESLVWTADGKILASASNDRTIRLWSSDGKALTTLWGHTERVLDVAWSPDGKILASASFDKTVKLWSSDGKSITLDFQPHWIEHLLWSLDGNTLISTSMLGRLQLLSADGRVLATNNSGHSSFSNLIWSPNGGTLATTSIDKTARLWLPDGSLLVTMNGHVEWVTSASWSPDSSVLATGSHDRTVRLWSVYGQPLTVLWGHANKITCVAWSPNGKIIASASLDGTIILWTANGGTLATIANPQKWVQYIAWSADSKFLVSVFLDGTIHLWSPEGVLLTTFKESGGVKTVKWSPTNQLLACGHSVKGITLLKINT